MQTTQADCQEPVQERHNDYVAKASREHIVRFAFLRAYLESANHAEILFAEFAKPKKRTTVKSQALRDALWNGYYTLKADAADCAKQLTERGQLLFAFPDTTALQARAA